MVLLYIIFFNLNLINILNIIPQDDKSGVIEIEVKGIKNIKGSIMAALHQSADGFQATKN
jgi:uncharacterized protein (DUF2141 family)